MQSEACMFPCDTTSVELIGVLDRMAVPEARRLLIKLAHRSSSRCFDVDLAQVSELDTAGVALLVELSKDLSRRGRELRLSNLNLPVKRMIRLAGVDRMLESDSPEDEK